MSPKTILVVDDEPDVRTYLKTLFEDHGFRVETASNGAEGVAMFREMKPDLVTLDLTMPEQSGVKAYREIRADSKTPIVVVTGVSTDIEKFLSTRKQVPPPDAFVFKPIDKDKLLETVQKLIQG